MSDKTGRNDPCPCGSGKKYKQCCIAKKKLGLKGHQLKWVNKPMPNLMERTFGNKIHSAEAEVFKKEEEGQSSE